MTLVSLATFRARPVVALLSLAIGMASLVMGCADSSNTKSVSGPAAESSAVDSGSRASNVPAETTSPAASSPSNNADNSQTSSQTASHADAARASPGFVADTVAQSGSALETVAKLDPKTERLLREQEILDQQVWAAEVDAQNHEVPFIDLWDAVRGGEDKFGVMKAFPFTEIVVGSLDSAAVEDLDWGISKSVLGQPAIELNHAGWIAWLDKLQADGWELVECEYHHSKFDPAKDGDPAKSVFSTVFHVANSRTDERIIVRGNLDVEWAEQAGADGKPVVEKLDATDFMLLRRRGPAPFEIARSWVLPRDPSAKKAPITTHPILCYDWTGDGLSEIVVGGHNEVYVNQGNWEFAKEEFCLEPPQYPNGAVVGDFDGDGRSDYFCGTKNGFPQLYFGSGSLPFSTPPREIVAFSENLRSPTAITTGDVDGDGDLDVFIGQYKPPYLEGHMPTPYYDANDGFPAYLLINDGQGNFNDRTEESGLGAKRFRRTYSTSLVDLNNDNSLDLIVVSDFAGVDVYFNDGEGHFTDVTKQVCPQKHAFGMSHTFGDYNLDGLLDFYAIGMSSTTARRLDYMGLRRQDYSDRTDVRKYMGFGNLMYLSTGDSFDLAPFKDDIARSGWSWGSTTFDFDNDGDSDIYIANGHMSGKSCKDYCTRYWTHDVYTGTSKDSGDLKALFGKVLGPLNNHEISWNGFEHNVLWMNLGGHGFVNVAFLMGCGFEFDARVVISDDLDGDGRMDLIVEQDDLPNDQYKLHLIRNRFDGGGHWIGARLYDTPAGGPSPWGAKLALHLKDGGKRIFQNVTGHSVWSQHAPVAHWGLGRNERVEAIEIRWPNGEVTRLDNPAVDEYHAAPPPQK